MRELREHCGVVGVAAEEATFISLEALKSLQHRGQESAGLAFLHRGRILLRKGLGLVEEVINSKSLGSSELSIGHVRYSTTGDSTLAEVQPMVIGGLSLAFNGTITNFREIGSSLGLTQKRIRTDTEVMLELLSRLLREGNSFEEAVARFMEVADGGYAVVLMTSRGDLIAFRDPSGFRPLVMGKVNGGFIFASEDAAIRHVGGSVERDVRPGEVIIVRGGEVKSLLLRKRNPAMCSFEYIYFARPDSTIDGLSVYEARFRLGVELAKSHPARADVVIPVPDSGRIMALGFSSESGIPLVEGLYRNPLVKRTFIAPSQEARLNLLFEKFSVIEKAVKGRSVVLVDDSIVRGNTMRNLVNSIRDAGANAVHIRVGSPMIKYPCYMGIDIPTREELIANRGNEGVIAKELGADSVEYLGVEEMVKAIGRQDLCAACFTGIYPLRKRYKISDLEQVFKRGG